LHGRFLPATPPPDLFDSPDAFDPDHRPADVNTFPADDAGFLTALRSIATPAAPPE
jgi:hypothetical protein